MIYPFQVLSFISQSLWFFLRPSPRKQGNPLSISHRVCVSVSLFVCRLLSFSCVVTLQWKSARCHKFAGGLTTPVGQMKRWTQLQQVGMMPDAKTSGVLEITTYWTWHEQYFWRRRLLWRRTTSCRLNLWRSDCHPWTDSRTGSPSHTNPLHTRSSPDASTSTSELNSRKLRRFYQYPCPIHLRHAAGQVARVKSSEFPQMFPNSSAPNLS